MADEELFTAKKIAEKIGVSAGKVNKYLKENDVAPEKTKGACKYFGPTTVAQVEQALKG